MTAYDVILHDNVAWLREQAAYALQEAHRHYETAFKERMWYYRTKYNMQDNNYPFNGEHMRINYNARLAKAVSEYNDYVAYTKLADNVYNRCLGG